jgi:hypothetical protein
MKEKHPNTFRLYTLLLGIYKLLEIGCEDNWNSVERKEAELLFSEYRDPYPEPIDYNLFQNVFSKLMTLLDKCTYK